MAYDILIIGAGLSGLFAGCLAARRRKKTLLLARGVGGTHIGAGTIGVADDPSLVKRPPPDHPYAAVGKKSMQAALDEFRIICAEAGYPMRGEPGKNFSLPTATGAARHACLIPETMIAGDLSRPEPFALAHFPGFRDFSAAFAAANIRLQITNHQLPIALPLPHLPIHRDSYATDIARLFDRPDYRNEVIAAWEPSLAGAPKRIGLPAALGLQCALEAKRHIESALGLELFEIPILPPSVPGLRLFNLLRDDFQNHGGRLIIGPTVKGRIENGTAAVSADTNGRVKDYKAEVVILASGGFLNGGLIAKFDGAIHDSVFGLPIEAPAQRSAWTSEHFLGPHPFAKFGLRVNKTLQPLDANGKPAAPNLRAIGSILAGADRLSEGSREGIELASAWRAVETTA
ncbi:MAG: anaerobic glycerol-3-phosphate dehydrogenase subunit B [Chloroflexi bacterium]|nr:anaerobic glycerol-3-phosphate dehydrogenase subunit B [Chloroflexota bacterium]